jgi:photosystem II stability/assembly factor-like uncharacterized protein
VAKNLQRVLLVLFVLVDIVLIGGAIRHVNGTPPGSDLPDSAAADAKPSASPEPAETGQAATQIDYTFRASEAVALSLANDGTIVFGARGRCAANKNSELSVSTNSGEDFVKVETGLTTTLAVRTTGAKSISVVGTDADCDPRQVTSTDGGKSWAESDSVDLWYPAPDETTQVVSPRGSSRPSKKCVITSVSQVTDDSARVSCANGTFLGSGDNGKTWVRLGRLDNARVGTFVSPSKGYALARYNGCGANVFATTDGGVSWQPRGCISGDPAQAISATTNRLAAVVANDPYVSTDDGRSWIQP